MVYRRTLLALVLVVAFAVAAFAAPEGRLLRFPDIHNDMVVFVYAGDLWTVPTAGGQATRLTSHEGIEQFPKFSPDGKWIAFTGQYDGSQQVYVMPAEGGEPKQLTFYPSTNNSERFGADNMIYGWTPDGSKIVFRSQRDSINIFIGRIFMVSPDGGLPEAMPMPESGSLSFSPDGKKIAYNRIMRDFRPWKRYKGGMAQEVWIFDLATYDIEKITDWEGTDNFPMWFGDKIYFNSDRDAKLDLWVYDLNTKESAKVTNFPDYDVKFPSQGPGAIVFENGGYLYVLDPATNESRKIEVTMATDRVLTRSELVNAKDRIDAYDLGREGKRAVFTARGEIFTVPAEHGNIRNLTNTPGAREKYAAWSPDGKWIAYMSDRSGEDELYIRLADGTGEETQITSGADRTRFEPVWSPDSKKIVFSDKSLRLFLVDVQSKTVEQIDETGMGEIHGYAWAPDSNWIAYTKALDFTGLNSIYVYSLKDKSVHQVTTNYTNDNSPAFDPEGKYLFFVSERDFQPNFTEYEFDFNYDNMTRPYVITLQADTPSPFAPESDEVKVVEEKKLEEKKEGEEKKAEADKPESKEVKIDFEGIADRAVGFPVPARNYTGMFAVKGVIFYAQFGDNGIKLIAFDLNKKKATDVISGIRGYSISPDGTKILVRVGPNFQIINAAAAPATPGDGTLDLAGMTMKKCPKCEWKNSFNEVWRRLRDYFYVPNMHGVDWAKMKERYGALLPYVSHRTDLTYVLSEMVSELCAGHAYVGGGDQPTVSFAGVGLIGATFESTDSGYFKLAKIYAGENWNESFRSPLTEDGISASVGDYVLAIDGVKLTTADNPYAYLYGKTDRTVTLKLNSEPKEEGAREVTIKPIRDEWQLRYYNWVKHNRDYVTEKTNGRVGYIHVPDMDVDGLNEFVKWFYTQLDKEGLIVDVRCNGGGFVSQLVLDRLQKTVKGMSNSRNFTQTTYPQSAFVGHMVGLTNKYAASDGDVVSFYWKEYGLGPLIGTRTWGGVVGYRGMPILLDGGYATVPEFGMYDLDGNWIMENHGADPTIVLDNLPKDVIAGVDAQLDHGIELVLKAMEEDPRKRTPKPTKYPVR